MKQIILAGFAMLSLLIFSCENNDDENPEAEINYTTIDIITGLNLFDANGAPIGQWKSPNTNAGDVNIYPNPATDQVFLFTTNQSLALTNIRIVAADCLVDSTTTNIPELSTGLTYELSEIEAVQSKEIPIENFNGNLVLDLSDLPSGFYKVFFEQASGTINWENIYLDPDFSGFVDFAWLDNRCN